MQNIERSHGKLMQGHLNKFKLNNIYTLDGFLYRLVKINKNGIHIFQIIDSFGVAKTEMEGHLIISHGLRIITKDLNRMK